MNYVNYVAIEYQLDLIPRGLFNTPRLMPVGNPERLFGRRT